MAVDPEKAIVLWPTYFDLRASREDGRRIAKRDAIESPSAQMLFGAVKSLGLDCILELEKSYPRFWQRNEGRVLVEPKMKKAVLIHKVAAQLKTMPRPKAKG